MLGNDNNVLAKYFYGLISQNNLKVECQKVPFFGQRAGDPYLYIGEMVYTTSYIAKAGRGKHWSLIIMLFAVTIIGIIFLLGGPDDFTVPTIVSVVFGYMTYFSCYILFASMTKERTRQVELVNYIIDTFANKK